MRKSISNTFSRLALLLLLNAMCTANSFADTATKLARRAVTENRVQNVRLQALQKQAEQTQNQLNSVQTNIAGISSAAGPQGPMGPSGPQGAPGPQGELGLAGKDGYLNLNQCYSVQRWSGFMADDRSLVTEARCRNQDTEFVASYFHQFVYSDERERQENRICGYVRGSVSVVQSINVEFDAGLFPGSGLFLKGYVHESELTTRECAMTENGSRFTVYPRLVMQILCCPRSAE
jgi:hypothetical protein